MCKLTVQFDPITIARLLDMATDSGDTPENLVASIIHDVCAEDARMHAPDGLGAESVQ